MVRKDVNHPSVIIYSIGNEITDGSTPDGMQLRVAPWPRRCARSTTPASSRRPSAGSSSAGARAVRRARDARGRREDDRGDRGQHHGDHEPRRHHGGRRCARPSSATRRPRRTRISTSPATTTWTSRFELDAELFPHRVIVATESTRRGSISDWAGVPTTRTSSAISPGPAGTTSARRASAGSSTGTGDGSACPGSSPTTRGSPPGAATSTSPVIAVPQSYYREIVLGLPHRPVPRRAAGPSTTASGRALEPVGVDRRRGELELARPRGRAGGGRGLRRRRRGRAVR